ncbi:MAG TPA: glycosyltransferase [Gaiellaceae bacterium]|nr:glycosyltransferase [Gaiellaceae bacterium]
MRVGFVGTYPPTRCGIATFTASLAGAMADAGCRIGVVACAEAGQPLVRSAEVVAQLVPGSVEARSAAVAALDGFDVAVVQHEFGIYGGEEGSEVVDLLRGLSVPSIVVLHTVLRRPTPAQRRIVEELGRVADRLVVQSAAARARLLEQYLVEAEKVWMIPHGARPNLAGERQRPAGAAPLVLTWGLLGRDKGIEWGIEAIARLGDLDPAPRYLVVGQTHPKVLERLGEEYRESLRARAAALGVGAQVEFDDGYHDTRSLLRRVREADVVLLPYRSREQVVSGVLVEALASGKPVVATRFPHAEELLAGGAGLLVPHEDSDAIAQALRRLFTDDELAARAAAAARREARMLAWSSVGARYVELAAALVRPRRPAPARALRIPAPRFDHLLTLSDRRGVFEHAKLTVPRREHGYCTDDVARALVVLLREPRRSPRLERLAETCLAFLERAQLPDGRCHNRLSADGAWLDEVGPDDATGRALWAAGTAVAAAARQSQRARAERLFGAAAGFRSPWPRANAFAVLGAVEALAATPTRRAESLLQAAAAGLGRVSSDPGWPWPEPRLAYANAVLAEARIAAGVALGEEPLLEEGLELLEWLVATETRDGRFSFTPVGGWARGEPRPGFDQQPIEAAAMADACARAFDVTGDPVWRERTLDAAAWFLGRNDVGVQLYDAASGGCRDGLEPDGVNENEGAESTIALISALQQARRVQAAAASARRSGAASTLAAPMQRSAAP